MQTTLDLDEQLVHEAREKARREGKTLAAVVEDALRVAVKAEQRVELPVDTESRGGFRVRPASLGEPRVPIGSLGHVMALLDEIEIEEAREEGREPRFR